MDRRRFLRSAGIGAVGAAAVAAPAGAYLVGRNNGEQQLSGDYTSSVKAGQRRGSVNVWWSVGGPNGPDDKVLGLTFDDGPTTQFSAQVLDILDRYDVRAAANTLVHGALWFGFFTLVRARITARRAKKGRCLRCAYDRRGLAPAAVCPECGASPIM